MYYLDQDKQKRAAVISINPNKSNYNTKLLIFNIYANVVQRSGRRIFTYSIVHLILHQGYPIQYNGNADNTCIYLLNIMFSQYINNVIQYSIKIFVASIYNQSNLYTNTFVIVQYIIYSILRLAKIS